MSDYLYKRIYPVAELAPYIYCYWGMEMHSDAAKNYVILPDGYFDILFYKKQHQDSMQAQLIGLSTQAKSYRVKKDALSFAISFRLPAAEFLLQTTIADLLNTAVPFTANWNNIAFNSIDDLEDWKARIEDLFLTLALEIPYSSERLFTSIYQSAGDITVTELSDISHQTSRQLNRYFRKWFGLSLKEYLAILRYRNAFSQLHAKELSPDLPFYDQSHFIREVKRFSGVTPGELAANENDRFVQFSTLFSK